MLLSHDDVVLVILCYTHGWVHNATQTGFVATVALHALAAFSLGTGPVGPVVVAAGVRHQCLLLLTPPVTPVTVVSPGLTGCFR